MFQGTTPAQFNALLGFECSPGVVNLIETPSTGTLEIVPITGGDLATPEGAPFHVDLASPESLPPPYSETDPISAITTVATPGVIAKPTLHDFVLIKRLGDGAFGSVFLARHKPSGARVALKAISKVPRSKIGKGNLEWSEDVLLDRARRPEGGRTFGITYSALAESCALHRARGEKNILQIQAAFHDFRYYYIATVSQLISSKECQSHKCCRPSTLTET